MSTAKKYVVDKSKPALVTGATGYIAGVLIKELMEEGVTVHATVRDLSKTDRFRHLSDLNKQYPGKVKFFEADLMQNGSFEGAMKGCGVVFHTASPVIMQPKDGYKEVVEPAVTGTANVLNQATNTSSVTRVVLTSSIAATYSYASDTYELPDQKITEQCWNRKSTVAQAPYSYSKTLAEQTAWVLAGSQTRWSLAVIMPSIVLGPGVKPYHENSESNKLMYGMGVGAMAYSGCPDFCVGIVDVRDVAHAHVVAAYSTSISTGGRYLLTGYNSSLCEVALVLGKMFPSYPIPKWKIPKLILLLLAPAFGRSRTWVWNNISVPVNFDNTKSRKELGIEYRPMDETLRDMFQQFIDNGIV